MSGNRLLTTRQWSDELRRARNKDSGDRSRARAGSDDPFSLAGASPLTAQWRTTMPDDLKPKLMDMARKWLDEAVEHEKAAEELDELSAGDPDNCERDMHDEAARVYRNCAADLLEEL